MQHDLLAYKFFLDKNWNRLAFNPFLDKDWNRPAFKTFFDMDLSRHISNYECSLNPCSCEQF